MILAYLTALFPNVFADSKLVQLDKNETLVAYHNVSDRYAKVPIGTRKHQSKSLWSGAAPRPVPIVPDREAVCILPIG